MEQDNKQSTLDRFQDWCNEKGILSSKLFKPALLNDNIEIIFEAPVQHKEAFLSVPQRLLLSVEKAKEH